MAVMYYEKDADRKFLEGKTIAIIGYGSQGHAHAQNLTDSGVDVTVGLRKNGASWSKVEAAGIKVAEVDAAVKGADVVMILLPDEQGRKERLFSLSSPGRIPGRFLKEDRLDCHSQEQHEPFDHL